MQWDNTITSIFNWLGSLSWPIAVLIIFIIFKSPISKLIAKLKTVEWKDLKLGFGDKIKAFSLIDDKLHDAMVQPLPTTPQRVLETLASRLSADDIEQSRRKAQERLDEDTKRAGYQRGRLFQLDNGQWAIAWEP